MRFLIYTNLNMQAPQVVTAARGEASVFSARSPDPDHEWNEDSAAIFAIDDDRAVLALADGVGGQRGGEIASGIAIQQLRSAIEDGVAGEINLRACIIDAFENANHAIVEKGLGAATTLAVVEIDSGTIRSYHAGDSEIITVGQRGKLKQQTVSHSPVGYAYESGVIDEKEAMSHDDRHLVSNVVGDPEMRIEIGSTLALARRDTIILASDGLTDNLHTEEVTEIIRKGPILSAAQRVAAIVRRRMTDPDGNHPSKPDDFTFIIFRRTE
jgi:serine/threonine protein phosphatase PrpC